MKRGIEKSHQIRKTTIKLFLKNGFRATSIDTIASAVGLKKGSLYHYISNKNDLLSTGFEKSLDEVNTNLKEIVNSNSPPDKKLENAIENHIKKQIEYFDEYCLYLQERRFLPKKLEPKYTKRRETNEKLIERIIKEGVNRGFFRKQIDVQITKLFLFGMLNWMTQWYKKNGRLSPEEISKLIYNFTIHGIGA